MDSNKKPVTEAERRLQTIISELDITISDLLDKAGFALMELVEGLRDPRKDDVRRMVKADTYADIAYDYLTRAQSTLTSLILRERREGGQESEPTAGDAQEIIRRIQQIRDPKLLTKILTFIESWTEDKGGQAYE